MRRSGCGDGGRPYSLSSLRPVMKAVKRLAIRYREITGKPLGVAGEIAEYEAARLMGVRLCPARTPGYDAVDRSGKRIQIKGRVRLPDSKLGQKIGSIRLAHDWDVVWLVEMDEDYNAVRIDEAPRAKIRRALRKPGSTARRERGVLSVRFFQKHLATPVWPRQR